MARGMAAGEPIISQANTPEFEEGHARTFGESKVQRGRWVWDEAQGKLVSAEEYQPPERAVDAPILAGRFYENVCAVDGTDIGSRRKRNDYMKAHGYADTSDYKGVWEKAAKEREAIRNGTHEPTRQARIEALREARDRCIAGYKPRLPNGEPE